MCPPRHGPHVGGETTHPASTKVLSSPSSSAWSQMRCVAGITIALTPSATLCPRMTSAAARMSEMRPFVHEPMTTWSMATFPASRTGRVLDGRCGNATVGSSSSRSISMTRSYSASASAS